jgi:hypothetical protein
MGGYLKPLTFTTENAVVVEVLVLGMMMVLVRVGVGLQLPMEVEVQLLALLVGREEIGTLTSLVRIHTLVHRRIVQGCW